MPTPLRWFWRIYVPTAALALLSFAAIACGPAVELRLAPVRGEQSVKVVERTANRLCWEWTFVKLRAVASDNIDAFLEVNGEPSGVANVFDRETGHTWGQPRTAVPARAEPYTLAWCASLPPYIRATDTVVVRQTAFYPGFGKLWRLSVPFPDVVSPGVAPHPD